MSSLSRDEREAADALVAQLHCGDAFAEREAQGRLAQWMLGKPEREDYVRSLNEAARLMDNAAPGLRERYPRKRRAQEILFIPFPKLFVHAAAVCTLVVAIAAVAWWANPVLEQRLVESGFGEQRIASLADGSRLTLNTSSRVTVTLRLRSREAVLEQGEALFEVSKSARRPWTTFAADSRIDVLGTVFALRRDGGLVRLTVFEGRVAFDPGSGAEVTVVEGGQAASSRNGSLASRPGPANLSVAGAWRDKRMVFEDTPLGEALAEAQRYRRAQIIVDPAISNLQITGAFPTTDPERLLDLLPDALPVEVRRRADGSAEVLARTPEASRNPVVLPAMPRS